jgi:hypothetical protein
MAAFYQSLDVSASRGLSWCMAKPVCKGEHEGHLCVLASRGRFLEIKDLARTPAFICFNCGRVAECDANLCNPMPLEEKPPTGMSKVGRAKDGA